ncbi:MAG TPA: hypothetical protein VNT20_17495 [Flavisolibacter sp.]|jgi:hypothetical protein|nr:hypothetical protein [Flavisolibacter sp.]
MRNVLIYAFIFSTVSCIAFLESCKKETINSDPYEVFSKPYTTGIIQFSYKVPFSFNGRMFEKDTTITFTSAGDMPNGNDDYGYNKPSILWAQIIRANPKNIQNSASIYFRETDLNLLALPYTFKRGSIQYAQLDFVNRYVLRVDANGSSAYYADGYYAETFSDNFVLTILAKENDRLQGKFSGTLRNILYGDTITVKNGLFDVKIVQK